MATRPQKRIPNSSDLAFLTLMSRVKDGRIASQDEINSLDAKWRDIATYLNEAYARSETQGFWSLYGTLSVDNFLLREWKDLIAQPAAPDEDSTEEDSDKRFTKKDDKRIIKLYSIEEVYEFPDPTYIISKILPSIGTSMIYGMSGTGKTFTALHLALCIAHGESWMGRLVKPGPVWYINTEGNGTFKRRIKGWYIGHPELEPTANFKIIPWSLDLRDNFQDLLDTIEAISENEKPALIIFDNFSMCTSGVEQSKQEQVAPILKKLNDLAQEQKTNLMVLHHTNKEDDFNGSMAFRNHVDTMIQLKKEDKADRQSPIIISSEKARDDDLFRKIKVELKSINLYFDEDEQDFITSCVVVESSAPIKQPGLKDVTQNILDLLGDDVRSYTDWRKESTEALGIAKATFDRAREELEAGGYIEKCKVDGVRFDRYRKVKPSQSSNATTSESGTDDE
jgi:SpoVK/Ycf46/Vps4 family AAA+-type ATPase